MVALFVIIVLFLVFVAPMMAVPSNKENKEEEYQKAKSDVARTFPDTCRMLEALDILEDVLKPCGNGLNFCRYIEPSLQTNDTVFKLQCSIINSNSRRSPKVQESLNSIVREKSLRTAAKNSGERLPTVRGPDNYTVWCHLTDKQIDTVDDMITDFNQLRNEYNDIVLEGSLLLRFDNPSGYNSYTYRVNMYVKALAEAIHERFPRYGFEADTYGIHFRDKNGVVSYKDI